MLSVLDLFRIGIGPSSSHTVGPMRIARRFLKRLEQDDTLRTACHVVVELQGSLALTGIGHGTLEAVSLGMLGCEPETVDPDHVSRMLAALRTARRIILSDGRIITFDPAVDITFAKTITPQLHPNGMKLLAFGADGAPIFAEEYYSTGGGFIASRQQLQSPVPNDLVATGSKAPLPFGSAADLLSICARERLSIEDVVRANEDARRPRAETDDRLDRIGASMLACIARGLQSEGTLPGGLNVARRAPDLWRRLQSAGNEQERLFDWLHVYAIAVNEENAAGGRVVTAPTNGAAGIIPSVLRHYCVTDSGPDVAAMRRFLLTAGGVGILYKQRASISGAEMGCQGEVGVACSMAAAGLAAVWQGTPQQVANAAEIGMEHNLGLTCDPVGGLVQIPCIERNAIGAVKAVSAARLAMQTEGPGKVTLDQVIETMRQTGLDMSSKYKETALGGLAVNVVAC